MGNNLVYIILINYNNTNDTIECIGSLLNIDYDNFKIIIVDNGSEDKEREKLTEIKDSKIQIILSENSGFSGGNNIGIKVALENNADYVCLLNNDTIVEPDFLNYLLEKAESNENAGIVCPLLYDYYNPDNISYYGGYINLFRGNSKICMSEEEYIKYNKKFPFFATGCCMLIKRKVIETIGLLDESYFLYYEDTDYSVRVNKKYEILLAEKSKVYHKESSSTNKLGSIKLYYMRRNRMFFIKKNISYRYKVLAYSFAIAGIFKNFIAFKDRIVFKALFDFVKKNIGKYNSMN